MATGLGAMATPASAHTISGPRPTNYRSRIVAFAPEVPGVSARVVDLGAKFELTNRSSSEITVLGYEGEPYLRIGPSGVFENLHSQATYINTSRQGGTVPVGVDTSPTAVPEWKKISSGRTARWHDHRIHWMSPQPPPPVAQSPGRFYHLSQQNIVFQYGDRQSARVAVALDWVPGPSGVPWIPVIVVLFALGVVAALLPRWWRVLAVLVGVVVISDIAHAIAFEIPRPGGHLTKTLQFFGASIVSIAVWIAAVPTIVAVLRRRAEALYGVVFVGLLIGLIGGVTDLATLWKSQLPDAGPHWLTRLEVVVALGLGAGLVVGALVRIVRSRAAAAPDSGGAGGGGQWLTMLVAGLSDAELARLVPELDADEVLGVASRELAVRAAPAADAFASGSLAFVTTDERDPVTWSVVRADGLGAGALTAARGGVPPEAAAIRAPFATMLRLLAGTLALDHAVARELVSTSGDAALLASVAPDLPENEPPGNGVVSPTAEDPTSAS